MLSLCIVPCSLNIRCDIEIAQSMQRCRYNTVSLDFDKKQTCDVTMSHLQC